MKTRVWALLGFKFGAVFLALAAVFLVLYFYKPKPGTKKKAAQRQVRWLVLGGGSYLLALGILVLVIIACFTMSIPTMGDFSGVSWQGGDMTAENGDGAFEVKDKIESFLTVGPKQYHRITFTLGNSFDNSVTIQAFKVISRIDGKEVNGYSADPAAPFVLKQGEDRAITVEAEFSGPVRELAKQENLDDYGLTAYLTVVTSEGKMPGIPLRFPDKPGK